MTAVVLAAMLVAAMSVAGCGGSGPRRAARVLVTPRVSLEDQPVQVRVEGLSAHKVVSLRLSSRDATGAVWASMATFAANARGVVDPGQVAPRSGDYAGVWPMGLMSSMQPVRSVPEPAYSWSARRPMRFTLRVIAAGKSIASTTLVRRAPTSGLVTRGESLNQTGFIGRFVYRRDAKRRTAIVLLGGSEGGLPDALSVDVLAAEGYSVLALGYFKLPGLSQQLSRIPLEYFERALRWMDTQPEVDPRHIAILGVSRGSEAALLSGAYFPGLVSSVIALDPSSVAIRCDSSAAHPRSSVSRLWHG
jgi:hypothetical protein